MIWPTLCVDNFFDEPNKVIELSKSLDYESSNVYPVKINRSTYITKNFLIGFPIKS